MLWLSGLDFYAEGASDFQTVFRSLAELERQRTGPLMRPKVTVTSGVNPQLRVRVHHQVSALQHLIICKS